MEETISFVLSRRISAPLLTSHKSLSVPEFECQPIRTWRPSGLGAIAVHHGPSALNRRIICPFSRSHRRNVGSVELLLNAVLPSRLRTIELTPPLWPFRSLIFCPV